MKNKSIAVIPARGGSKGLLKKNIQLFQDHPLISWPIQAARKSKKLDKIVVSTDDEEIKNIALEYGAEVPFLRNEEVSLDLTTTEETLRFSLKKAEEFYKTEFDICVFLTCTDLFRSESWIDTAIEKLENNKHLESVFVVSKTHKNFWKIKDNCPERLEEWMKIYSNRQVREPLYREDTGLTCASRSFLWREGRRIGDKVEFIINNNPASMIDIHSELDLNIANKTADWLKVNDPNSLPVTPQKILKK